MYTGNNIVTNGLTLLLDASNPRSYVGEPTTNLANNETTRSLSLINDTAGSSTNATEIGPDWKKVTITTRGSNPRMARFPYITQNSGSVRTYSVEYIISSSAGYYWKIDGQLGYNGPVVSGSGKFIYTLNSTSTGPYSIFLANNSGLTTGLNDVIYYRYYQVEDLDHATPFTPISRPSTWLGLTSTPNNSDPINGFPLYSNYSSSLQYIDFTNVGSGSIGTSISYITSGPTTVPLSSSFTVEAWILRDASRYPLLDRESIFSNAGSGDGFRTNIDVTGVLHHLIGNSNGTVFTNGTLGSGYNLGDAKWHHIVISHNISTPGTVISTGYVDGVNVGNRTSAINIGSIARNNPGISYACCSRYRGYIAKLATYGRVLTADEVLQNYNASKVRYGL
jgi:hypothetical protein